MTERMKAEMLWVRGSEWYVIKREKGWYLADCFGNFPAFKTKQEAVNMANRVICWEE